MPSPVVRESKQRSDPRRDQIARPVFLTGIQALLHLIADQSNRDTLSAQLEQPDAFRLWA